MKLVAFRRDGFTSLRSGWCETRWSSPLISPTCVRSFRQTAPGWHEQTSGDELALSSVSPQARSMSSRRGSCALS